MTSSHGRNLPLGDPPLGDSASFFSRYATIALVANSEAVDIGAVQRLLPPDTLFVFFTRCTRVLSQPFAGDAILCHRMKDAETFNEGDRHVERARAMFAPGCLKAEVGIIARDVPEGGQPAVLVASSPRVDLILDLDHLFWNFYTPGMTPTTGFAMTVWLLENVQGAEVSLCGFTGVRGTDFRMRIMHDWTLEQTVLRLFARHSRLRKLPQDEGSRDALNRISVQFPQCSETEVALVAAEVLSDRVDALDRLVAMLWSVARAPRALHRFIGRLRTKAR